MNNRTVLIFISMCALLPIALLAQQHAWFHALEPRDNRAGRSTIAGPPVPALYAPNPQYTKEARIAKVKGTVIVEGTLGTDGCLRNVRVTRVLGYGLDESAIEAVQRWKFKPFLKNGVPTQTTVRGELYFDPAWSPNRSLSSHKLCWEQ